jgi:hypothetical protein
MDAMRKFHTIMMDPNRDDLLSIIDYETDKIDLLKFWTDERLNQKEVLEMRLIVDTKDDEISDVVGNPLSLLILSEKLISIISGFTKDDVQFLKPNLMFDKNTIDRFKIMHTIKSIECLDMENSGISSYGDSGISVIGHTAIFSSKVPEDTHIFRLKEDLNTIIVSDELAQSLVGKNINGLAFAQCESK